MYQFNKGMIGQAVQRDYRFINKSNGKEQSRNFSRNGKPPDFSLDSLRNSEVRIQKEFTRTLDNFKFKEFRDTNRYDQTEHPIYPNFENTKKCQVLGNCGWGIDNPKLKYSTAHPQKGKSVDRWHLKFLDKKMPSNFAGHPTGFAEKKPDKVLFDISPE